MSGAGLVQFVINLIALLAAGGIFFLTIDRVAPDAFFARIARIAIGALLLIALVLTIAAVFGLASAGAIPPRGIIYFAIAVIVAVVVLYLINLVIDWIAAQMGGGPWVTPVKYVLGAIVLIGLLLVAANVLFGAIPPFRIGIADRAIAAIPTAAAEHMPWMLIDRFM